MREGESRKSRRLAQPQKVPLPIVPWNIREAKPKKKYKKGLTRNNHCDILITMKQSKRQKGNEMLFSS